MPSQAVLSLATTNMHRQQEPIHVARQFHSLTTHKVFFEWSKIFRNNNTKLKSDWLKLSAQWNQHNAQWKCYSYMFPLPVSWRNIEYGITLIPCYNRIILLQSLLHSQNLLNYIENLFGGNFNWFYFSYFVAKCSTLPETKFFARFASGTKVWNNVYEKVSSSLGFKCTIST